MAVEVKTYLIHPKNNPEEIEYDYAILRLKYPVDFERYPDIRPICLPDKRFEDYAEGTPVVGTGWGRGTFGLKFTYNQRCNASGSAPDDNSYAAIDSEGCFIRGWEDFSPSATTLQKVDLLYDKISLS